MQEITTEQNQKEDLTLEALPLEDKQNLVGAFDWLVKEDKKQNPSFYQSNTQKYD